MLQLIRLESPISQSIILVFLQITIGLHISLVGILHHHQILKLLSIVFLQIHKIIVLRLIVVGMGSIWILLVKQRWIVILKDAFIVPDILAVIHDRARLVLQRLQLHLLYVLSYLLSKQLLQLLSNAMLLRELAGEHVCIVALSDQYVIILPIANLYRQSQDLFGTLIFL